MSVAMIYPEAAKLRRSGSSLLETKELGVSSGRVSQARTVLRFGKEDLAPAVMSGAMALDEAYKTACERRDATAGSSPESRKVWYRPSRTCEMQRNLTSG